MGGKLWVKSEVGHGAEFHFTARLGTSEEASKVRTIALPTILRNVKVLVVDDNRTNRRILEGMLQLWEINVTSSGVCGTPASAPIVGSASIGCPVRVGPD